MEGNGVEMKPPIFSISLHTKNRAVLIYRWDNTSGVGIYHPTAASRNRLARLMRKTKLVATGEHCRNYNVPGVVKQMMAVAK